MIQCLGCWCSCPNKSRAVIAVSLHNILMSKTKACFLCPFACFYDRYWVSVTKLLLMKYRFRFQTLNHIYMYTWIHTVIHMPFCWQNIFPRDLHKFLSTPYVLSPLYVYTYLCFHIPTHKCTCVRQTNSESWLIDRTWRGKMCFILHNAHCLTNLYTCSHILFLFDVYKQT